MTARVKGRFTFRFAAVCFAISAVFELFSLREEAILFDRIVGGVPAMAYHLVYAALFTGLAYGLWNAKRSGYYTLWVTSVIYTVDRLQLLFVGNALTDSLNQQVAAHPEVLQVISTAELMQILTATMLAFLAGWWAFVGYGYYRRGYFGVGKTSPDHG